MSSLMGPKYLYRTMLRQAKGMTDYNFRMYSLRRIKTGFQKNRHLQGEEANAAMQDGERQLHVLQRQVVLSKLYPSARSVMDTPSVV